MEHQQLQDKKGTINHDDPMLCPQCYAVDTTYTTNGYQWSLPFVYPNSLPSQYQNDTTTDWSQLLYAANWLFMPSSQPGINPVHHLDSLSRTSAGYDDLSCTQSNTFEAFLYASAPPVEACGPSTTTPHRSLPITPSDEDQWSSHAMFITTMAAGQLTNCDEINIGSEPVGTCFETRAGLQESDNLGRVLGPRALAAPVLVHTDLAVTQQPWQPDASMPHQEQGPNHTAGPPRLPVYGCAESPANTATTLPSSLAGIQVQYLSKPELKKNDLRRRNRMAASKARGLKKVVAKHGSFGDPLIC
ncbi:hypothetical protein PpBr36_09093 [Pyricularia pennisetigena]|uniref:hypothetical protein n=1 Tax=Pyricularia pennisetigena TaxID=1578925 RepID=UPI001153F625|nr:hypothetical protein PpBr36_09093 [Pyricularia pennisetigena]TLS24840.1 hypothetical protein PpBr36_09093 [Pyricularia pennisetigena]